MEFRRNWAGNRTGQLRDGWDWSEQVPRGWFTDDFAEFLLILKLSIWLLWNRQMKLGSLKAVAWFAAGSQPLLG